MAKITYPFINGFPIFPPTELIFTIPHVTSQRCPPIDHLIVIPFVVVHGGGAPSFTAVFLFSRYAGLIVHEAVDRDHPVK
jgi:hypothetical protein